MIQEKYCKKCRKMATDNDALYCPKCGTPLTDYTAAKQWNSLSIGSVLLAMAIMLIAVGAVILFANTDVREMVIDRLNLPIGDYKYIQMVKNGSPKDYPDETYGDRFDIFFSNCRWKYIKGTEGQDVVEFTGICMYDEKETTARIQFVLDVRHKTFDFEYLELAGEPQNELMKLVLLEKVFEDSPTSGSFN